MSGAAASDRCPRCGCAFHCGANDAARCACTAVALDAATLAELRLRFSGCLCLACLRALTAGAPAAPQAPAVASPGA